MCGISAFGWAAAAVAASAAHKQANAQNAMSEYQGRVDANNAQLEEWQAADAKTRGDLAVNQSGRKYAALEGTQRASLAARGLDIGYGSANAILTDTDYFGAYDEGVLRANSRREAWAHGVQADNYLNDAAMLHDQRKANNPFIAGAFAFAGSLFGSQASQGGGTMLTGSRAVADRWYGSTNSSAGSGVSGYAG